MPGWFQYFKLSGKAWAENVSSIGLWLTHSVFIWASTSTSDTYTHDRHVNPLFGKHLDQSVFPSLLGKVVLYFYFTDNTGVCDSFLLQTFLSLFHSFRRTWRCGFSFTRRSPGWQHSPKWREHFCAEAWITVFVVWKRLRREAALSLLGVIWETGYAETRREKLITFHTSVQLIHIHFGVA